MLKEYLSTLANAFRNVLGTTDKINAQDFSSKVHEVYMVGHRAGYDACEETFGEVAQNAYSKGLEDGEQEEYIRFWKGFLDLDDENNPQRTHFQYAFAYSWDDEIYKIPENIGVIKPKSADSLYKNTFNLQIGKRFETEKFDFSRCENINFCFNSAQFSEIKDIDVSSAPGSGFVFAYARARSISIKGVSESTTFDRWFIGCIKLQDFEITGVIGNTIDFKDCPLTVKSIKSVINALSTTVTGQTASFNKNAVNNAFETAEGLADGSTSEEWLNLVASKPNWTISLV